MLVFLESIRDLATGFLFLGFTELQRLIEAHLEFMS